MRESGLWQSPAGRAGTGDGAKVPVSGVSLALRVENGIDGGCFQTVSKNLGKNLKDCENLLVFPPLR